MHKNINDINSRSLKMKTEQSPKQHSGVAHSAITVAGKGKTGMGNIFEII